MIDDKNLRLVGATWYNGVPSPSFLARARIDMGTSEQDACSSTLDLDLEVDDDNMLICPGDVCSSENIRNRETLPACIQAMSSGESSAIRL